MDHVARFRVLYIQAAIAIAAALGAELAVMQDYTAAQLAAVTWVRWLVLVAAVTVNAGNTIVASLHAPPAPSLKITQTKPTPTP